MVEKRKFPRFKVRFRSSFSSTQMVGGEGEVVDLSVGGCRVMSDADVKAGTVLEIRIQLPDQKTPMDIGMAVVRWKRGEEFGVEFLQVRDDIQERINGVLVQMEKDGDG